MNNRTCPKCKQAHVIPDGYCGVCRECTLQPLNVERGTDSQQRGVSRHRKFWMETPAGNDAHILGDPRMPAATKLALGEMIDAAVKAANAGKLGLPANAGTQRPGTQDATIANPDALPGSLK